MRAVRAVFCEVSCQSGPMAAIRDEILLECDKDEAGKVETRFTKVTVDRVDEIINGPEPKDTRVPAEFETRIA